MDETFDNIVAFWNPKEKPQPGQELLVGYRLYWGAEPPARPPLAHCVASRTGLGGVVGKKREYFSWRFAVDFEGGELAGLIDRICYFIIISTPGDIFGYFNIGLI